MFHVLALLWPLAQPLFPDLPGLLNAVWGPFAPFLHCPGQVVTFIAQEAGVRTRTIMEVSTALNTAAGGTDPRWTAGGFGNTRTSADVRRLNALYASYLKAGALCLEGRGYVVTQ